MEAGERERDADKRSDLVSLAGSTAKRGRVHQEFQQFITAKVAPLVSAVAPRERRSGLVGGIDAT
jgi:hypothetical protein